MPRLHRSPRGKTPFTGVNSHMLWVPFGSPLFPAASWAYGEAWRERNGFQADISVKPGRLLCGNLSASEKSPSTRQSC